MVIYKFIFLPVLLWHVVWGKAQYVVGAKQEYSTLSQVFRAVESSKQKDSIEVVIMPGRYSILHEMTIVHAAKSLVIKAQIPGTVILDGGVYLEGDSLLKYASVQSIVRQNALLYKWTLDLKTISQSKNLDSFALGNIQRTGFGHAHSNAPTELFINGLPMQLAAWPDTGFVKMGKVLQTGDSPASGHCQNKGGEFEFEQNRPLAWLQEEQVWLQGYFNLGYADDAIAVKKINEDKRTFSLLEAHHYGLKSGAKWSRWRAFNVRAELDQPGEYYISKKENVIEFMVTDSVENIQISFLQKPFLSIINQENIKIQGIVFENTRGMAVNVVGGNNVVLDQCVFRNIGNVAVLFGNGVEYSFNRCNQQPVKELYGEPGHLLRYLKRDKLYNNNAGIQNGITNSVFKNTGSGGVILGGGDKKSLQAGNNFIENCVFYNTNRREKSYRPAIMLMGVGQRVSQCSFWNLPSMAVGIYGNNHIVEYSRFVNVVKEVDDLGALYYGRNPTERGHKVRYNIFANINNKYRTSAIYHDDGAGGMDVYGNYFVNAGQKTILIGGGSGIQYYENIFLNNELVLEVDRRLKGWAKKLMEPGGHFEKSLREVDHTEQPYSVAYPILQNYLDGSFRVPKENVFTRNVFMNNRKNIKGLAKDAGFEENVTIPNFASLPTELAQLLKTDYFKVYIPPAKFMQPSYRANSLWHYEIESQIHSLPTKDTIQFTHPDEIGALWQYRWNKDE
jgi:hypothetical protein